MIRCDVIDIFSDTCAGLSEVMITETCIVKVLKGVLEGVHVGRSVVDGGFEGLDLD